MNKFKPLDWLLTRDGVEQNMDIYAQSRGEPPVHYRQSEQMVWHAFYAEWRVIRWVKEIYLKYGWDVDAGVAVQGGVRREEFLVERGRYWEEVVTPMQEFKARMYGWRMRGLLGE